MRSDPALRRAGEREDAYDDDPGDHAGHAAPASPRRAVPAACCAAPRVSILGAILAGGAARRFGSDKAAAAIAGHAMIEHVAARLAPQCDALVVVGRSWPGIASVADRPRPGLGPLGGLAGALFHAQETGHTLVLTSGCDLPDLPDGLSALLSPGPAVVQGQPLLGLWPAGLTEPLIAWLDGGGDRAMRSWIAQAGARRVPPSHCPHNINTPEDLARFLAATSDMPPVTPGRK